MKLSEPSGLTNLIDYTGSILPYVITATYIFASAVPLHEGDEFELIAQCAFYSLYLLNCFTRLTDLYEDVANLRSFSIRVAQLYTTLLSRNEIAAFDPPQDKELGKSLVVEVENLYFKYAKAAIIEDLSFNLEISNHLIITGESGSGKSTLLQLLAGNFEPEAGRIYRDLSKKTVFLPQTPYLGQGSLHDQVSYPDKRTGDASRIVALIKLVQLSHLESRAHCNWDNDLSKGEEQRLCIARALYQAPDILSTVFP